MSTSIYKKCNLNFRLTVFHFLTVFTLVNLQQAAALSVAQYIGCLGGQTSTGYGTCFGLVYKATVYPNPHNIDGCTNGCASLGYTYASEQVSSCCCGDSYNTYIPTVPYVCNTACRANASQICGGATAASVYSVCPSGTFSWSNSYGCQRQCGQCSLNMCQQRTGACLSPCTAGWNGTNCTTDIDECTKLSLNNCSQLCSNTPGSYYCSCSAGYSLQGDRHTCHDANECEDMTLNNCNQICNNMIGSYTCSCRAGYYLDTDQHTCTDVDECAVLSNNNCQQMCNNFAGSYNCSCQTGYSLQSDRKTCIDIDECSSRDISGCAQNCTNTEGHYWCSCSCGYILQSDNKTCSFSDIKDGATVPLSAFIACVVILAVCFMTSSAVAVRLYVLYKRALKQQQQQQRPETALSINKNTNNYMNREQEPLPNNQVTLTPHYEQLRGRAEVTTSQDLYEEIQRDNHASSM